MNKKPMILAIASLGSVALIGTGFAGWVISTEATASAQGSITAYVVTDKRVRVVSESWDVAVAGEGNEKKTEIIFGKPDDSADGYVAPTYTWLTAESDVKNERLQAVYTVNLWSSVKAEPVVVPGENNADTYFSVTDNQAGSYAAALTNNYITGPAAGTAQKLETDTTKHAYYEITAGDDTTDPVGKNYVLKVHFDFGWGTVTNGQNPFLYFNANKATDKDASNSGKLYGDVAVAMLEAVKAANQVAFEFKITLKPGTVTTNN